MRICLLLIVGCLTLTGCRVNPRAEREIALLRAEILDLEDQYYTLKSRCEANGFITDGVYYDSSTGGECVDCGSNSIIYEDAPGTLDNNGNSIESINSTIEDAPASESANSNDAASVLRFVPHTDEKLPRKVSFSRNKSIMRSPIGNIASVSINRQISRGEDLDGVPGHEGLTLLIQPKDSNGLVQESAGHITVRLSERTGRNQERQIGIWQFTPRETSSFFVKDGMAQQGVLLHLPWDDILPHGNRIQVLVRFTENNQRPIATKSQIRIVPPPKSYTSKDPLVAQWIEHDVRWDSMGSNSADDFEINVDDLISDSGVETTRGKKRISAPGWRPVR